MVQLFQASQALEELFPETTGRKLYLCNLFDGRDRRTFCHWVMGGELAPGERQDALVESFGSLTAFTEKAGRGVFINDMRRAERSGIMLPMCDGPVCAIAAPIQHLSDMYGVVIVKSDRYDLFPERDLGRIEFVGRQMGLALRLRNSQH